MSCFTSRHKLTVFIISHTHNVTIIVNNEKDEKRIHKFGIHHLLQWLSEVHFFIESFPRQQCKNDHRLVWSGTLRSLEKCELEYKLFQYHPQLVYSHGGTFSNTETNSEQRTVNSPQQRTKNRNGKNTDWIVHTLILRLK